MKIEMHITVPKDATWDDILLDIQKAVIPHILKDSQIEAKQCERIFHKDIHIGLIEVR